MKDLLTRVLLHKTPDRYSQFIRYGLVSLMALAVDFSTLVICHELFGLHYLVAATIGFSLGVVVNYTLSIMWVFNTSRFASRRLEFGLTALIAICGLLLNDWIMWILVGKVDVNYIAAKACAALFVFCWNFVLRKKLLHTERQKGETS